MLTWGHTTAQKDVDDLHKLCDILDFEFLVAYYQIISSEL